MMPKHLVCQFQEIESRGSLFSRKKLQTATTEKKNKVNVELDVRTQNLISQSATVFQILVVGFPWWLRV